MVSVYFVMIGSSLECFSTSANMEFSFRKNNIVGKQMI